MISSVELPADPGSPAAARRFVVEVLGTIDSELDVAELLTSELVTNAVLHARTPVEVSVEMHATTIRVAVRDASPIRPVLRHYDRHAITGRGLQLLERLAERWGVDAEGTGKVVWFELRTGGGGRRGTAAPRGRTLQRSDHGPRMPRWAPARRRGPVACVR